MIPGSALILVISDSHGNLPVLTAALKLQQKESALPGGTADFTAAVFLGDGADDIAAASAEAGFTVPWYRVRGNGDYNFSIPDSLVLEIPAAGEDPAAGKQISVSRKLFLAHGNRYDVDGDKKILAAAARAAGAEAALFGHTHVPHCSMVNGIFLLNPGSIGRSRINAGPTFAVLNCPLKGPLSARFFCLVMQGRKIAVQELEL